VSLVSFQSNISVMSNIVTPTVTRGGLEYVERFTRITATAFAEHPFTRRFISENDDLQAGAIITPSRRFDHFLPIVKGSAESGAELVEAGGWAGIALW
jgi:hypothetical protein